MSALSLAFVLVLLARPFALWNAGFQLSFLAVGGLALLAKPLARAVCRAGEPGRGGALERGWRWSWRDCRRRRGFSARCRSRRWRQTCWCCRWCRCSSCPALLALGLGAVWLPLGRAVAVLPQAALELILRVAEAGGALALTVPAPGTAGVPAVPAVDAAQLAAVPGAAAAKAPAQRRPPRCSPHCSGHGERGKEVFFMFFFFL